MSTEHLDITNSKDLRAALFARANTDNSEVSVLFREMRERRYYTPHGYDSPDLAVLGAACMITQLSHELQATSSVSSDANAHVGGVMMDLWKLKFPTYFVGEELFRDCMDCTVESSMHISDIQLPDDGMVVMLPLEESQRQFGLCVPYVCYCVNPNRTLIRFTFPASKVPKITGYNYVFFWRMDETVQNVLDRMAAYKTILPTESAKLVTHFLPGLDVDAALEVEMRKRVQAFMLRLLLLVVAEPRLIELGGIARKAKIKHGRERSEMWNANFIGRRYVANRQPPQGGTHDSPRLHRRRGHIRSQVYGPRSEPKHKVIFIKATWVGLKSQLES